MIVLRHEQVWRRRDSSCYQSKDTEDELNMYGQRDRQSVRVCVCVFQSVAVQAAMCVFSACRRRGCAASTPGPRIRSPWWQGWYTTTGWPGRSCSPAGCGRGLRRLSVMSGSEDSFPVETSRCWWCPETHTLNLNITCIHQHWILFWKNSIAAFIWLKNTVQIVKYYYNLKQPFSIWIYFKM